MATSIAAVLTVLAMAASPLAAPQLANDQDRVYVGGIDAAKFEALMHPALEGGYLSPGSRTTDIGRTVVTASASDINQFEQEARRQVEASDAFELVTNIENAEYVMVVEADYISDGPRRRMRGVLKLVDASTGEDVYRRRVDFHNIASRGDLNREFTAVMNLIGEWAVEAVR